MILSIATRELRGLFLSPLAWTLSAVVQFILAWLFLMLVEEFLTLQSQLLGLEGALGVSDLVVAPLLRVAAWLLLLITPLLTMRLLSEERRSHTLGLLLSAPVASYEIVLGKYLGLLTFLLLLVMLIALMPLSLLVGSTLDLGKLSTGLLGLLLLLGSFSAAGCYCSTRSAQPITAAVVTFGLLLWLSIIDAAGDGTREVSSVFAYLSLWRHYDALLTGLISSADIIYYLLSIVAFLGLSVRCLNNERRLH
jgi:ABC-2 type transport system permease protein